MWYLRNQITCHNSIFSLTSPKVHVIEVWSVLTANCISLTMGHRKPHSSVSLHSATYVFKKIAGCRSELCKFSSGWGRCEQVTDRPMLCETYTSWICLPLNTCGVRLKEGSGSWLINHMVAISRQQAADQHVKCNPLGLRFLLACRFIQWEMQSPGPSIFTSLSIHSMGNAVTRPFDLY